MTRLYARVTFLRLDASLHLQVWLSPWQVSHVLSIVSFVESTLHRVIGPEPGAPPATPMTLATSQDQAVPTGLAASAMKTQLKLTLSVEISLVSILCLVMFFDSTSCMLTRFRQLSCVIFPLNMHVSKQLLGL